MELKAYEQQLNRVSDHIYRVCMETESLRRQYEEVISERKFIEQAATKAEEELQQVRRIIDRYTAVEDAVVASDGYTYERKVIEDYIKNCIDTGVPPKSQQTDQEISSCLYPNRSLKTLLDRLVELLANEPNTTKPTAESHKATGKDPNVEYNAQGQRVHPCIRVYGFCNYGSNCAYAFYPYEACLSNLKGKCRFRNQCHERHVDFRGALNANGEPVQSDGTNASKEKTEESGSQK
ncbi:RNA binding protein [Angomonas deanei]|nr:RNA binding protein [Angomonas deanei]EPY41418.1 RNA binding protein [Angomonas deanei]|eukprot:EPY26624.1 RNA binding protein [Angomonas deanei]